MLSMRRLASPTWLFLSLQLGCSAADGETMSGASVGSSSAGGSGTDTRAVGGSAGRATPGTGGTTPVGGAPGSGGRGEPSSTPSPYVSTASGEFTRNGKPYVILSTSIYPWHDRDEAWIARMVDTAHQSGFNNIRAVQHFFGVMSLAQNNPDALLVDKVHLDETIWRKQDFLIAECEKRGMTVDLELTQLYSGEGGLLQAAGLDAYGFRNDARVEQLLEDFYVWMTTRRNTITGKVYKDDPTISMWSVLGEHLPYICTSPSCGTAEEMTDFVLWLAEIVQANAPHHIVGADGFLHVSDESGGVPRNADGSENLFYYEVWDSPLIDYGGVHLYNAKDGFVPSDWPQGEWKNVPAYAQYLHDRGKPFVVETGVPYGRSGKPGDQGMQKDENSKFLFNAMLELVEEEEINGVLLWNWNDASFDFDLYPGLTPIQDDLIEILGEHGGYFTPSETL